MVSDVAERRTEQVKASKATIDETRPHHPDRAPTSWRRSRNASPPPSPSATTRRPRSTPSAPRPRGARKSLADWRLAADVAGSDLPLVALDAYVKAAGGWASSGRSAACAGRGSPASARSRAVTAPTAAPASPRPVTPASRSSASRSTAATARPASATPTAASSTAIRPSDRAVGPDAVHPGVVANPRPRRQRRRSGQPLEHLRRRARRGRAAVPGRGLRPRHRCRAAAGGARLQRLGRYADLVVRTARNYQAAESQLIPPPPPRRPRPAPAVVPGAPWPGGTGRHGRCHSSVDRVELTLSRGSWCRRRASSTRPRRCARAGRAPRAARARRASAARGGPTPWRSRCARRGHRWATRRAGGG